MTIGKHIAEFMTKFIIIPLVALIIAIICCYFLFLHEETPVSPELQKSYQAQQDSLMAYGDLIKINEKWCYVTQVNRYQLHYRYHWSTGFRIPITQLEKKITLTVKKGDSLRCAAVEEYLAGK